MKTKWWIWLFVIGMALSFENPSFILAQDQDYEGQEGQDPPTRVARLNHSDGSVSFQPGGEGDWVQAVPNRPLTTGDNLWADRNSRAELHVGSTALRLGSETSLTFLELDDQTTQLKLSQGSLILRVRHLDDGDNLEIDTPNLAFNVQRIGEYRIDVNADGTETDTTVWHGRGEVTGGGYSYTVVAGQNARFTGTDELDHQIEQIPNSDDLDNWAFSRDEHEDHSESANYISTEMTGSEDLDDYGSWHYVAEYGPVWTPRGVESDWAPYRHGHWVWVDPWGWTWVEEEPWGFAPFHYGRWAYVSSSWCWVPGPVVVRPVYAPALVAFVGGGGFGVSVGFGGGGGVGWFPLGPREVYVPWYRTSPRYVNNVNVTNTRVSVTQVTNVYNSYHTTNINNTNVTRVTYVNQHVNNAVTVVSHETFANARPVAANVVHVDQRQIEQAQVVRAAPVQPVRASVVGAGGAARVQPPAALENRKVVATRMPTPPKASFEQRRTANVQTERPTTPQPVAQAPNPPNRNNVPVPNQGRPQGPANDRTVPQPNQPRGQEPAARTNEVPRPQPEARPVTPAENGRNNAPQPNQPRPQEPTARTNEVPRPQTPAREASPAANERNVPQPEARPVTPPTNARNIPRPPTPAENVRPQNERQINERPQNERQTNEAPVQPAHPLVRQAPPVQERAEQQKSEEQKFSNWHQQREVAQPPHQAPPPRPAERQAAPPVRETPPPKPPREEKPKQ